MTQKQINDTKSSSNVQLRIQPSENLKKIWREIPPNKAEITGTLKPITDWLCKNATSENYTLNQGDYSATYIYVDFANKIGSIPLYATTDEYEIKEKQFDETKKMIRKSKYVMFRKYKTENYDR